MYCIRIVNCLVNYRSLAPFNVSNISRSLFTQDSLGVTAYIANRQRNLENPLNTEKFKIKIEKEIVRSDPSYNIVPDLKRFLHLMDNSNDDINLLHKALILYDAQRAHRKGYDIGPTVMRAFYHLGLLDQAIEFFENPRLGPLFKQVRTFEILLDWLFDKKQYNRILQLNESMMQWIEDEHIYPSAAMNSIVMATYLRMGTTESYQLAFKLYQDLKENGLLGIQYSRTFALVAEMKRRVKQPDECLNILAGHNDTRSEDIRFVKILAYSDQNRFKEIIPLIRVSLDHQVVGRFVPQIPRQMLRTLENGMADKCVNQNIVKEFQKVNNELERLKRITGKSMDDVLCSRFPSKSKIHGIAVKKGVVGQYLKKKATKFSVIFH